MRWADSDPRQVWPSFDPFWTEPAIADDEAPPTWATSRRLGLRFSRRPQWAEWEAYAPLGYVVASFALLPAARGYRRWRRGPRRRPGQCARCGYDLRATPGRCPECGAVPKGVIA